VDNKFVKELRDGNSEEKPFVTSLRILARMIARDLLRKQALHPKGDPPPTSDK
jgi:hypothetical protein